MQRVKEIFFLIIGGIFLYHFFDAFTDGSDDTYEILQFQISKTTYLVYTLVTALSAIIYGYSTGKNEVLKEEA
ncbi:MAG: hypothetical protein R6V27_06630 [Balneolaceae bacterium]